MSALIPRALVFTDSVNTLRSIPGQQLERFVWVMELGAVFRWSLNSPAVDDGFTAIVPIVGGYQGAWLRLRTNERGEDLTSSSFTAGAATLGVGTGYWQVIAAGALVADTTITLDPTGACLGDWKELTREDVGAFSLTIINGGPNSNVLVTMPQGVRAWGRFDFDGDNFVRRRSGLSL